MKARVALLLALASCAFDVQVDGHNPDASTRLDAGSSMLDEFCPEPAKYFTFEVRLDPTAVDNPSCWNGQVVPADHTLPAETFQIVIASSDTAFSGRGVGGGTGTTGQLIAQNVTVAVEGLGPQKLGDAPVIEVGPAMGGFEWKKTKVFSETALSKEERVTSALFAFDRLDLQTTAGQLVLRAEWACVLRGGACQLPPDRQTCAVTRTFVAQKLSGLPARFTVPTTDVLEGATPFLVSVDLGALSRETSCSTAQYPEPYELTPNLRSLEVWQIAPFQIRLPRRTIEFPVAPTLQLESDFGSGTQFERTQLHGEDRQIDPTTRERRSSSATLNGRACGAFMLDGGSFVRSSELVLETSYECTGDNCGASTSTDRGSCRVVIPWLNLRLP